MATEPTLDHSESPRRFGRGFVLAMLAAGLLVVGALPAGAVDAEPEDFGDLIKNFVTNSVVVEDVTNVLDLQIAGLTGDVLAGVDLGDDAAIAAALVAAGVDPSSISVTRSKVFDGRTTTSETTVTVDVSPGAVYIGDIEVDPCLITVLEGTVTVNDVTDITHTDFYTTTVTVTGVLLVTPPADDTASGQAVDVAGESVSTPAAAAPQPVSATPTFNG